MSRVAKLIHRIEQGRHRPKFAEFEWLLVAVGFELRSRKGSHRSYRHPAIPQIVTIQPKGNMAQDYQVRDFIAKVRQHNLLDDKQ